MPTAVFDKVQVAHPERHTANGAYKNLENDGWGNYAYLAGWNGEYKVGYSLANSNSTIKGRYQKLNETVIFGSLGGTDFSYENDSKIDRIITTQTTVGGKEVTSRVNYFVNFFNNGMGVSWNVPREWNYQIYVPIFSGELTSDQIELVKAAAAEDNTYTLPASANDSKVYHYGSTVDIDGNTYYYYNSTVYRLLTPSIRLMTAVTLPTRRKPLLRDFPLSREVSATIPAVRKGSITVCLPITVNHTP